MKKNYCNCLFLLFGFISILVLNFIIGCHTPKASNNTVAKNSTVVNSPNDSLQQDAPIDGDDPDMAYDSTTDFAITNRNFPIVASDKEKRVECRKIKEIGPIFNLGNDNYLKLNIDLTKNNYNDEEISAICSHAYITKDSVLEHLVYNFTNDNELCKRNNYLPIICLSGFNTNEAKSILNNKISEVDTSLSVYSALSLVQLGVYEISFECIKKRYQSFADKESITTALMTINSPEAIELLKVVANDKNQSYALDAIAGLSLLGYCDYAFNKFVELSKSYNSNVRDNALCCIAYYIGTQEAFKFVSEQKKIVESQMALEFLNNIMKLN